MGIHRIKANSEKLRGFKIKIYPTEDQKIFLNKQIELSRWVYNWALEEENKEFEKTGKYIALKDLIERFDLVYAAESWLNENIAKRSCEIVLNHVDHAYKSFFKGFTKHPKFKSKKYSKKSFEVRNESNAFYFKGTKVRISGLPFGDMIECKNNPIPKGIDDDVLYYRITITFDGYCYWLSLNTEVDKSYLKNHKPTNYENDIIGIDVGIRKTAVLSNGKEYTLPHRKLKILNNRCRKLKSRIAKMSNARTKHNMDIPSKNEEKLRFKEYQTRNRIYNIKHSFAHEMTTEIANMYPKKIVMEDLSIKTLKKMKHFAKSNPGILYDIRVMMKYKCEDRGIEFELADKSFPSSQICSQCGYRKTNIGSKKIFICDCCGLRIDRDLNAAINLSRYGLSFDK